VCRLDHNSTEAVALWRSSDCKTARPLKITVLLSKPAKKSFPLIKITAAANAGQRA
jgi:hypothetical protein